MGQVAVGVHRCLKRAQTDREAESQRRNALSAPGIPGSLKDRYEVRSTICDGPNGQILALYQIGAGRKLVSKTYAKKSWNYQFMSIQEHALNIAEIKECQLRHDNIISYFGFFESKDLFCAVMDSCDGGSVRNHLENKVNLDDTASAKIFKQVLKAVVYLHSLNIIHRDLRLEQFLFSNPQHAKVKLADLMHSVRPSSGYKHKQDGKPLALLFAAPEVLHSGVYSAMSDCWSLGCALYELVHGYPPFTGQDASLAQRILGEAPKLRPRFSDPSRQSRTLIKKFLDKDPYLRIEARPAISDPWFSEAVKITVRQRQDAAERHERTQAFLRTSMSEIEMRSARVMEARSGVGQDVVEQMADDNNSIMRSLTHTYSHLSISTPSSKQSDLQILSLADYPYLDEDTESEDWKFNMDRSDLGSQGQVSGGDSRSGTYINSEQNFGARLRGDWDEFDSAFFEEDRAISSCWSEAEYSDWTANEQVQEQAERDWINYAYPPRSSKKGAAPRQSAASRKSAGSRKSAVDPDVEDAAKKRKKKKGGAENDGSETEKSMPSPKGNESPALPPEDGGFIGAIGPANEEDFEQIVRDRSNPPSSSSSSSTSRYSATETLQSAGCLRSAANGKTPSCDSSASLVSAPWDYTNRSDSSISSDSSSQAGGRPSGGARRKGSNPDGGGKSNLATITEGTQLAVFPPIAEGARDLSTDVGTVTQRNLVEQEAAPWDARTKSVVAPRQPRDQSMIVMSRRSNSASSDSSR